MFNKKKGKMTMLLEAEEPDGVLYKEALSRSGDNAQIYHLLSIAQFKSSKLAQTERSLRKVLAL